MVDDRFPPQEAAKLFGPWDTLMGQLRDTSDAAPELIEALRTAHVELELQADELRRSQEVISSALATSDAMFEVLPLPLWVVAGGGRIVRANAGAMAMFAALRVGDDLSDLLSTARDRTRLSRALESIASAGSASVPAVEIRADLKEGAGYRGDLRMRRVVGDGGRVLAVAAFVDLTREMNREAALDMALAQANDAALAKSDFLRAVSHELRTPLNAVVGFSQLLQRHFDGSSPVEASTGLDWIKTLGTAARHLTTLVSDLIDLQVLEAGRMRIQCVDVQLQPLINEAVELTRYRFEQHGVKLIILAEHEAAVVHTDPARCKQVILNLLDNAAKYTPRSRSVYLEVEAQAVGYRVIVRDEGPGLTRSQQANLFEAFNRLGAERSGVQGLGLGLAISRQLAVRMGGQVGCDSAPGRGSQFWCWLPATSQAMRRADKVAAGGKPEIDD